MVTRTPYISSIVAEQSFGMFDVACPEEIEEPSPPLADRVGHPAEIGGVLDVEVLRAGEVGAGHQAPS